MCPFDLRGQSASSDPRYPSMTTNNHIERGLFYGLLALLVWLPIPLGSHRAWAWSLMEIWSFALLGTWVLCCSQGAWARLKSYWPLLGGFALLQVWTLLQLVPLPISWLETLAPAKAAFWLGANPDIAFATLSMDPNHTRVGLLKGISYCAILFLMLALVDSTKRLKAFALAIVIAGTLQAFYGVLQALSGSDTSWVLGMPNSRIATGGFVYKNHFGNFMALCLCIGIGLLIASLSGKRSTSLRQMLRDFLKTMLEGKAIVRLCLVMMVIALVMSRSRMANTAFFASLTIVGVLGLLIMRHKSRSLTVLLASLLVIDLMIVSSWFGLEKVKTRLEETALTQETRDEVVQYGQELIRQHPVAGTGNGTFYSSYQSVNGPDVKGYYDFAHNDYLQFAIEFGLPMTLLLGVLVLWSLWHALVALRTRRNSLMQGMAFAAVMAIVAELIMLLTDFHLQAPATTVYFMLCLGLAWVVRFVGSERQL